MSQKIKTSVEIDGSLTASQIANATTDTDKFLVSDGGVVKYRTGAEMLSDLGVSTGTANRIQHPVKAGVSIFKGQAVYVTDADGTNMIVGLASNLTEATSSKTMGLVTSNVAANGFTDVVTEGILSGLNTSSATVGDPVWLGTNGNLRFGLSAKPSAPSHLVFIGIVTRVNANNGEIFVKVQNGFELNEIHDVDLKTTVPVNGEILGFNGTLWVNKTIAGWLGYTPQAQLNGTGFVKASGTTITYDNSTYVPTSRTLTINGTAYDLSADRSWTISGLPSMLEFNDTDKTVWNNGKGNFSSNTSFGDGALKNNSSGTSTTAYGNNALRDNSSGNSNTALGVGSLISNSTGSNNVAIGQAAGQTYQNISTSIFIGNSTAATAESQSNVIVIGHNAVGNGSNSVTLGNGSITKTVLYGNVGIGTTSPIDKLNVNGGITSTGLANPSNTAIGSFQIGYDGTNGIIRTWNSSPLIYSAYNYQSWETMGSERMRITSGGNVGIGTTSPNFKLSLVASDPTFGIVQVISNNNGGNATTGAKILYDASGIGNFWEGMPSGANAWGVGLYNGSTNSEYMRITSGGNVGIGTSSPTRTLQVVGTQISQKEPFSPNEFLIGQFDSAGNAILNNVANAMLAFNTNNTRRMTITSGGNVGIGTTSPSARLSVANAVSTTATVMSIGTSNNGLNFIINSNGAPEISSAAAVAPIYFSQGSTRIMTLSDNGNVGIGTTLPNQKLTVDGNVRTIGVGNGFLLDTTGAQYTNGMKVVNNYETAMFTGRGSGGHVIAGDTNIRFGFSYDYTTGEKMRITSGGKVLIGTTGDVGDYKLQVNGSILAIDSIYSNGDVIAYASSDIRLKDNILPIKNALEKVKKIGGYTFDWNNKQTTYEGHDVGVIAQEIEAVLPEVVTTRDNGYKAVKYEKLTALLIESIKEQQVQIERLELLINKLTK